MNIQRLVFPDKGRCEVENAELDEKLGPGEVLLKARRSLISAGTELAMFTRIHRSFDDPENTWAKYPFRPGYASVSEVVGCGPECGGLHPGARVFIEGRHATFHRGPAAKAIPLPESISDDRAVFFKMLEIAMTAPRLAPPRMGEQILVIGAGLVGNLSAQIYAHSNIGRIAIADINQSRLDRARACGLIEGWNMREKPLSEWVKSLGPRGAEIVIESTGTSKGIDAALKAVATKGIVVLLGSPREKMEIDPYNEIHRKGAVIVGAHESMIEPAVRRHDGPLLMDWLAWNKIKVDPLITHRLPLWEGLRAYEGLRDKPEDWMGVLFAY